MTACGLWGIQFFVSYTTMTTPTTATTDGMVFATRDLTWEEIKELVENGRLDGLRRREEAQAMYMLSTIFMFSNTSFSDTLKH